MQVIPVYRVKLAPVASLGCPAYRVPRDPLASRATAAWPGTPGPRGWVSRDRLVHPATWGIPDTQASESPAFRDSEDPRANKVRFFVQHIILN